MKLLTRKSSTQDIENFVQYSIDNNNIIACKSSTCDDVFLLRIERETDMSGNHFTAYFFNLKYQGQVWDRRSAPIKQEAIVAIIEATFGDKETEIISIHRLGNERDFAEWILE